MVHVDVIEELLGKWPLIEYTRLDRPAEVASCHVQGNTAAAFEDDPVTAQIRRKLRLLHRRITNLSKKLDNAAPNAVQVRATTSGLCNHSSHASMGVTGAASVLQSDQCRLEAQAGLLRGLSMYVNQHRSSTASHVPSVQHALLFEGVTLLRP